MRIRGTTRPQCSLCALCTEKDKKLNCTLTGDVKTPKDSCPKFKYDIFKYKPADKNDFGKFSKEDFEIWKQN